MAQLSLFLPLFNHLLLVGLDLLSSALFVTNYLEVGAKPGIILSSQPLELHAVIGFLESFGLEILVSDYDAVGENDAHLAFFFIEATLLRISHHGIEERADTSTVQVATKAVSVQIHLQTGLLDHLLEKLMHLRNLIRNGFAASDDENSVVLGQRLVEATRELGQEHDEHANRSLYM